MDNKDIVEHWCDWYMRPVFFPWEYFDDAPLGIKQRFTMGHLDKLYSTFKEGMGKYADVHPEFANKFDALSYTKSEDSAIDFFLICWDFVDKAIRNYDTALDQYVKFAARSNDPLVKGAVTMMQSKMVVSNLKKVDLLRDKMHEIWMADYRNWIVSV